MYLVLPLLGLYFLLLFFTLFAKDYYRKYKIIRIFESYVFCIIAPIPFLFLYFITRYIIQYWRNAPRFSAKTGALMKRLSESEENPFLKSGQIKEEYIKSVDYDVWMGQDKDDVVILALNNGGKLFVFVGHCCHLVFRPLGLFLRGLELRGHETHFFAQCFDFVSVFVKLLEQDQVNAYVGLRVFEIAS